jgi:dTDP-4-amino-4,6-dideoxygalactose transaminase
MGGHPSDLDRLKEIAARHKIALVEDSSHAHGSEWRGQRIGTFGVAGTFSFQSSKLMTADEGGIIILNDDNFERQARSVHDCGRMPGEWFYSHFIYGFNYRLSEWQGAVLTAQLGRLDERTRRRHQNARLRDRELSKIPGLTPQKLDERCTRNGQYAYIFHVDRKQFAGISTERFTEAMNAERIPNQASYPPLHELHMFRNAEYRKCLSGA